MTNENEDSKKDLNKDNKDYSKIFTKSFDLLPIKEQLLRGIYTYGFEKPSLIQQQGILPIIDGRDLIGNSQSGTGKTCVFTIGLLQRIDTSKNQIQGLILVPTRELAIQINSVISSIGLYIKTTSHVCVGGTSIMEDKEILSKNPHVVIGTPGRIYDMITRKSLTTNNLKVLILDEADEMLSAGFKDQIADIFRYVPTTTQICLFSATLTPELHTISSKFMNNPVELIVNKEELTLEGIKQYYVMVEKEKYKFETLLDIYNSLTITQSIIYCNTKSKVEWLTAELNHNNFNVVCIHGNMAQQERDATMKKFRSGSARILVSTGLTSRGLDIQNINTVVLYDIPPQKETYLHSAGRSGRFGRKGLLLCILTKSDINQVKEIETYFETQIMPLPNNLSELI